MSSEPDPTSSTHPRHKAPTPPPASFLAPASAHESQESDHYDFDYPFSFASISIEQLQAYEAALEPAASSSSSSSSSSSNASDTDHHGATDSECHQSHQGEGSAAAAADDDDDSAPPTLTPVALASPLDPGDMMPGLIHVPSPSAVASSFSPDDSNQQEPVSSDPLSALFSSPPTPLLPQPSSSSSPSPDSPILSTLPAPPQPAAPPPPPGYLPAIQNPVAPMSAALATLDASEDDDSDDGNADDEHDDEFDHAYMLGDLGHLQDDQDVPMVGGGYEAWGGAYGTYDDVAVHEPDEYAGLYSSTDEEDEEEDEDGEEVEDDDDNVAGAIADNQGDVGTVAGGNGDGWSTQGPSDVPTEITRSAYLHGTDIQGIDWSSLPITRATYRETRNKEYASYRNTDTPLDPNDPIARFDPTKHMYQFEYTKLSTKSSFAHFQLRNLVWAPTKNDVFYTHDAVIRHWTPLTRHSRTLVDCFSDPRATPRGPVRLSSMCAAEGVLVAGGYLGEYIIKPLSDARLPPVAGIVTNDPNGISNQIEITRARTGGALGALVASNDSKVRRIELERRKVVQTLELDWPVNCAVQSPDRSMLAVVGDSTETRIFDAVHGDEIMQLHGHVDFSFAAAWSPTAPLLATGNQDRTTRIYDLRFPSRTLHTLNASIGAVRSLRYAADGTLAIAEDADYVHLLCPRMQHLQSLDFFGEISGIAFTPDDMGEHLFIGNADEAYGSLLEFNRVKRGSGGGVSGWWGLREEVDEENVGGKLEMQDDEDLEDRAVRDALRMRYSVQGGSSGQYVEVDWGAVGDIFDIGMAGAELV